MSTLWLLGLYAAMDLFQILLSILLGIYPEVGLLNHIVILFLFFEEPPYCPQELYHFAFPLTGYKHFCFSTSLRTVVIFYYFCGSHPDGCEVV